MNAEAWQVFQDYLADPPIVYVAEPVDLERHWLRLAVRDSASPKAWIEALLAACALAGGHPLVSSDAAFRRYEGLELLLRSSDCPRGEGLDHLAQRQSVGGAFGYWGSAVPSTGLAWERRSLAGVTPALPGGQPGVLTKIRMVVPQLRNAPVRGRQGEAAARGGDRDPGSDGHRQEPATPAGRRPRCARRALGDGSAGEAALARDARMGRWYWGGKECQRYGFPAP